MKVLVDTNEQLVKANQQLEDANYDLRYELQEATKLIKAEEEAAIVMPPLQQVSVPATDGNYADMSLNKDNHQE